MNGLFASNPRENLLPYDGQLYDLGQLDLSSVTDNNDDLYQLLLSTLPWQSDVVTLFGKTHVTKRQIVWMGDKGISYRYAGYSHQAIEWHPIVFHVKQIIEDKIYELLINTNNSDDEVTQKLMVEDERPNFNACLLNYYPSGSEAMGYHADDEKELGIEPLIAAFSLGATRKMLFKYQSAKHSSNHKDKQNKVALYLQSGQLIVMAGVTQQHWKHSIAKTTKVTKGRISLTFRRILTV